MLWPQVELRAQSLRVIGACDPETYPLQKKRHTLEFLRTIAHLRPRTNTIGAVSRVRSALAFATHQFFRESGFQCVHTPVLSASDCEGAGEMFQVGCSSPSVFRKPGLRQPPVLPACEGVGASEFTHLCCPSCSVLLCKGAEEVSKMHQAMLCGCARVSRFLGIVVNAEEHAGTCPPRLHQHGNGGASCEHIQPRSRPAWLSVVVQTASGPRLMECALCSPAIMHSPQLLCLALLAHTCHARLPEH